MKIKYPSTHKAPQKNRRRWWNIGRVSAHDASPVTFDGEVFQDNHGNHMALSGVAPSRKKQIAVRERDKSPYFV